MRRLHWTLVQPQQVEQTIWKNLTDDHVKIQAEEFEELFCAKPTAEIKTSDNSKSDITPESAAVHIVDTKRAYNIDICLARLRMSHEHIRDVIVDIDESLLDAELIQQLLSIAPTQEEIEAINNFASDGDVKSLANAEKFFYVLRQIPRIQNRLKLLYFKSQYGNQITTIEGNLSCVEAALKEVTNSKGLRTVLQVILAFGNYMNAQTNTGQAYGFKLSALNRLVSCKSVDNQTSLLHYLVAYMQIHMPQYKDWCEELKYVKQASTVEASFLAAEVNKVGGTLRQLDQELKAIEASKQRDNFASKMAPFLKQANSQSASLADRLAKAETSFKSLLASFGETNPTKTPWEKFFGIFSEFIQQYQQAASQLEQKRFQEEKEKQRRQFQENMKWKGGANANASSSNANSKASQSSAALPDKKEREKSISKKKKKTLVSKIFGTLTKGDAQQISQQIDTTRKAQAATNTKPTEIVQTDVSSPRRPAPVARRMMMMSKHAEEMGAIAQQLKQNAAEHSATVGACRECSCSEFVVNPFKPQSCNNCFHIH